MLTLTVFVAISLFNALVSSWSDRSWWRWIVVYNLYLPLVIGVFTTAWFTVGGLRDFRRLFAKLRTMQHDAKDDGSVAANPDAVVRSTEDAASMAAEGIRPAV